MLVQRSKFRVKTLSVDDRLKVHIAGTDMVYCDAGQSVGSSVLFSFDVTHVVVKFSPVGEFIGDLRSIAVCRA